MHLADNAWTQELTAKDNKKGKGTMTSVLQEGSWCSVRIPLLTQKLPKVVYSQHTPVQFLYFGVWSFSCMLELCSILIWIVPKRRMVAVSSYDHNGHYRSTSAEKWILYILMIPSEVIWRFNKWENVSVKMGRMCQRRKRKKFTIYGNKMNDVARDAGHTPWVTNGEQTSLPFAFKLHVNVIYN